ncbi:hypothetical protein JRC04_12735 [Mycolicibacterium sp. S2-37]|uniref:hypothetical protein n=1 Tax=Mycolicibacterium sp. S2-37 TaxID=2810297 RepID=UPI001A93DB0B|nr:hypothetical protein [Mycolicibacterium sp. S2-37]MBO0678330.1 hypothetical protein [Mycolicibacterium sp. S2-37]
MWTFARVLAAAFAVVTVSVGAALATSGPAQAEQQVLEGKYTYTQADGVTGDWIIYPICVPVVGDLREPLYLPVGCHLAITGFAGVVGGDARLTNGVWTYTTAVAEGLTCPDGSTAPISETFEFNTDTMTGTRTTTNSPACQGAMPANMIKTPFTIAYKDKLAIPIDQYPLICEPGGLRRCF